MRFTRYLVLAAACSAVVFASSARAALTFNFTPAAGMDPQAIAGFAAAGQRWSNLFGDNITVNIDIAFTALGPGILGSASSQQANYAYGAVRGALIADASSIDDGVAVLSVPLGAGRSMLINRTANSPFGPGNATPYVDNDGDANNTSLRMSHANAKALGLLAGNAAGQDASISFSTSFAWDFDPSNGITAGTFDFVGVATHEIGHALGFISGVDVLDINSPPVNGPFNDNQFTFVSTLDLFRYSVLSTATGSIDWTADTRDKYFSITGGAIPIAGFATGRNFGDGQQASHWKDNLGIGIMDPTAAQGELLAISGTDIRAFDVIGYNLFLNQEVVPEPLSMAIWGAGVAMVFAAARRRRK